MRADLAMCEKRHAGLYLLGRLTMILPLITAGCSEELGPERFATTSVTGTVTEGGRPLARGWIEFIPVDGTVGNLRSGWIHPDGSFQVDGVAVGENALRLVYAGIQFGGGDQLFGQFATPIRRVIPAQPRGPLKIDVMEEAVRFHTPRPRPAQSNPSGPASGDEP